MTTNVSSPNQPPRSRRGRLARLSGTERTIQSVQGLTLLAGIVGLMWIVETINTIDSNGLDGDGIYARSFDDLWGILTAPFIHASFAHLIDNTIPLLFLGLIIALRGAARLAIVTAIVIVIGGLGTWLISSAGVSTIGASGVVFGYATYLIARGFFDRSLLELLTGLIVGVVWGGALISSLVPHQGISWQGHLSGAVGGLVAAYLLRRQRPAAASGPGGTVALRRPGAAAGTLGK
jgi:membrane associated rhomboid family serine protease